MKYEITQFPDMKADARDAERYIKNLIREGESQQLDFKFEISDAKKMARTFSAFANTRGGRLLIGVKDNGRISGVRSEEEAYMAESAAHVFCKPSISYGVKKWIVEGKPILEIEIPMSNKRPHYARDESGEWTAYLRVLDQNIRANRILVNVWKNESRQQGVLINLGREEKVLVDFLSENDRITLSKFIKIARTGRFQAEEILVNLILTRVLVMDVTERAVFYRLNPANTKGTV